MNWFVRFFSGTIGKKVLMALTGLFLIVFLIVHLIGNLQLLKADEGMAFNLYSRFMSTNPFILGVSYVLYAAIIIHSLWAILLTVKNKRSRGKGYKVVNNQSSWSSRNMGILGTFIFIFIVIHLRDFWAVVKFGHMPTRAYNGVDYEDLYYVVAHVFNQGWYVVIYTVSMVLLAFHLWHGFSSAFLTLGLDHVKYSPAIKFVGRVYAIVVPLLFAWIPIAMFYQL